MSYSDDEIELNDPDEEDEDLDIDADFDEPLDDDLLIEDDAEETEEFADLNGNEY